MVCKKKQKMIRKLMEFVIYDDRWIDHMSQIIFLFLFLVYRSFQLVNFLWLAQTKWATLVDSGDLKNDNIGILSINYKNKIKHAWLSLLKKVFFFFFLKNEDGGSHYNNDKLTPLLRRQLFINQWDCECLIGQFFH